jgi:DNA mismatch repair ATPase MutS
MTKIHTQLFTIRDYLTETLEKMKKIEKQSDDLSLKTYKPFIKDMNEKAKIVKEMIDEYNKIIPFTTLFSVKKVVQVGHIMKCFYQLYNKQEYKDVLEYTFGFNGYLENLEGLKENIELKNVGQWQPKQTPKKKNKRSRDKQEQAQAHQADAKFKNAYFPSLINSNPVKNSYELNKHMIITGPNAAGKTTLLKTTIFNIILSQQTGFGFYESAEFEPYDMIHCYINIPDTSGRDSLFQAEARRCKEILDQVMDIKDNNKKQRHFCVFDELYSGTNPYEAIGSAYAYLTFLNKYSNVNFVLTTHFLDLCKRVDKTLKDDKRNDDKSSLRGETLIKNYHMRINTDDADNFKYTYKLEKGISNIKGGVKVLKDLNYPTEIIESMNKVLKDITTF